MANSSVQAGWLRTAKYWSEGKEIYLNACGKLLSSVQLRRFHMSFHFSHFSGFWEIAYIFHMWLIISNNLMCVADIGKY